MTKPCCAVLVALTLSQTNAAESRWTITREPESIARAELPEADGKGTLVVSCGNGPVRVCFTGVTPTGSRENVALSLTFDKHEPLDGTLVSDEKGGFCLVESWSIARAIIDAKRLALSIANADLPSMRFEFGKTSPVHKAIRGACRYFDETGEFSDEEVIAAGATEPAEGDLIEPRALLSPDPEYPADARDFGIEGDVLVQGIVDEQGNVTELVVLRGRDEFREPAITALKRWKFRPALLNAWPVRAHMTLTITFRLEH